jgi:hypothetical protein
MDSSGVFVRAYHAILKHTEKVENHPFKNDCSGNQDSLTTRWCQESKDISYAYRENMCPKVGLMEKTKGEGKEGKKKTTVNKEQRIYFFLAVLVFKFRASCLLDRNSTT